MFRHSAPSQLFKPPLFSSLPQQDGWNQNHFLTPVTTLERDRFKSQPTLPTSTIQMSPINHPGMLELAADPARLKLDAGCVTKKNPLEFKAKMCLFCPQLPAPCPLPPCWASKSIETRSEIFREHSQLCNFIITKGTTPSTKSSIQVNGTSGH